MANHLRVNVQMTTMRALLARNLKHWMDNDPDLDSQPKLSRKSGVAQSHIGRILREESSATIDVVDQLARAFRRSPGALLEPLEYAAGTDATPLSAREAAAPSLSTPLQNIVETAQRMSRDGQLVLLGRAQELEITYRDNMPAKTKAS